MPINTPKNFDCVAAAQHMHEFLDGELPPELRAAMEGHLAGCVDCAATLAQLQQIEKAHRQLDARLSMPTEAYWQALPQRAMERAKASEKRRLLKLPRLKSPLKQTPTVEQTPQNELLYLPPATRKFLRGPVKYVLPLAAVAAFCFFMIRELREKPEASIMTASSPQQKMAETPARSELAETLEKPVTSESTLAIGERVANAPTPRVAQPTSSEVFVLMQDSLLGNVSALQGAGGRQGAGLAATAGSGQSLRTPIPATVVPKAEEAKALLASNPQLPLPSGSQENRPAEAVIEFAEKTKDEAIATTAGKERTLSQSQSSVVMKTDAEAQDRLAKSTATRAKKSSPDGRAGVSAMSTRATFNPADFKYVETRQRADQTADLKKREKIWNDFLKSKPDSSSRTQAILQLAQTLSAASDSTTKPDQLKKNIAFFRDNASLLRLQMGATEFDREQTRLQTLLEARRRASDQRP